MLEFRGRRDEPIQLSVDRLAREPHASSRRPESPCQMSILPPKPPPLFSARQTHLSPSLSSSACLLPVVTPSPPTSICDVRHLFSPWPTTRLGSHSVSPSAYKSHARPKSLSAHRPQQEQRWQAAQLGACQSTGASCCCLLLRNRVYTRKLNKMRVATGTGRYGSLPTPRRCSRTACSISSGSSTRGPSTVRIGRRWMEYQGSNNWDGLLDPLDDTLRSEIIRYGEFVQATYTCFDFDPASPSYATSLFPKDSLLHRSGLPCTGYHVTRNLHATSGTRLPGWARNAPSWLSRRTSWIGYVAVCQDEDEIARLGRRDVVVAFRGTATCLEWLDNLRATLTHLPCPFPPSDSQPEPMVESGFWSLFTSPSSVHQSLRDEVREEIARLLDAYGGKAQPLSLTVTGHSLGAALAVLTAYDITTTFQDAPMVTVVSFGGPRVGNASFCRRLEQRGSKVLRIVNTHDIITKVPGFVVDDRKVKEEDGNEGVIPNWLLSKTGWVYADIGRELRLSGRRTANVVACHDLSVYLNLVNQLSAKCPFRQLATQAMAGQRL